MIDGPSQSQALNSDQAIAVRAELKTEVPRPVFSRGSLREAATSHRCDRGQRLPKRSAMTAELSRSKACTTLPGMDDIIAWVQLVATLGLLGVTYWYAKTTRDMADSAKESAQASAKATAAAERSAEAARDAATVAQSQIKPEFSGRQMALMPADDFDEHVACLRIDSTGDAVVVEKIIIRRAFRESYDETGEIAITNAELTPAGKDTKLPSRLHHGEHLLLTHPSIQNSRDDPFRRFIIDVQYSFSENGGAGGVRELIIDEK